jgi:hypothetical protein
MQQIFRRRAAQVHHAGLLDAKQQPKLTLQLMRDLRKLLL